MKKIDINALIQLLGMVGIIISLIFVGLEMQQTQRIAIASAQEARMNSNRGYIRSMQESNLDAQSSFFAQKFDNDYSPQEIGYRNSVHEQWFLMENNFYQFQAGLMDMVTWESKRGAIGQTYNRCNARDIYESRKGSFTPEFRQIIDLALTNVLAGASDYALLCAGCHVMYRNGVA